MKLLRLLLRRSPPIIIVATLAGVLSGGANAGLLALLNQGIHTPRPWTDTRLVAGFVALCLALPLARALSARLMAHLGQQVVLQMRLDLCARILSAPLLRLESVGTPRLFAALTEDVGSLVTALGALPLLFVQGSIVAGCLVYLGWLSVPALAAVVVLLALGIVVYQIPVSRGMRYQRAQRELADQLWRDFSGVTGGVKELKLHPGRREALFGGLETTGLALRRYAVVTSTLFSAAAGWGQTVIFAVIGAVVFVLPRVSPLAPETLTGYALLLLYLMTPLEMILDTIPLFSRARISMAKVEELGLSLGVDASAGASAAPALPARAGWRSIELAGVTHSYAREGEERPFLLGPVDLTFTPGEIVFLVGGNGSGKTTLAKLILGLYHPESGELRVDGRAVDGAALEAHLQRFAVVFSDFHLFDSPLGLGGEGTDAQAAHYLSLLQLEHKVSVQDGRISTTSLSQGQRKRLALLTAYMEDRPVYLFDEWAADQDPVFKKVFYLQLLPELKARGKTVLAISHDDHYYGVADRIVKLDSGRVEYDGPPEGLHYSLEPRAPLSLPREGLVEV